jgi:hypothetical protein
LQPSKQNDGLQCGAVFCCESSAPPAWPCCYAIAFDGCTVKLD